MPIKFLLGKWHDNGDQLAPKLNQRFDGSQDDIVLTLPNDIKVKDLKWISVWCRELALDFGSLNLSGTHTTIISNINLKLDSLIYSIKWSLGGCQIDNTGPQPFPECPQFCKFDVLGGENL